MSRGAATGPGAGAAAPKSDDTWALEALRRDLAQDREGAAPAPLVGVTNVKPPPYAVRRLRRRLVGGREVVAVAFDANPVEVDRIAAARGLRLVDGGGGGGAPGTPGGDLADLDEALTGSVALPPPDGPSPHGPVKASSSVAAAAPRRMTFKVSKKAVDKAAPASARRPGGAVTLNLSKIKERADEHKAEQSRKKRRRMQEEAEMYKRPTQRSTRDKSKAKKPHARLNELLDREAFMPVWRGGGSGAFSRPVDRKKFPTYAEIVKKPVDLSMIKNRLKECKYRDRRGLLADFDLMTANAIAFNGEGSQLATEAAGMATKARRGCAAFNDEIAELERLTQKSVRAKKTPRRPSPAPPGAFATLAPPGAASLAAPGSVSPAPLSTPAPPTPAPFTTEPLTPAPPSVAAGEGRGSAPVLAALADDSSGEEEEEEEHVGDGAFSVEPARSAPAVASGSVPLLAASADDSSLVDGGPQLA